MRPVHASVHALVLPALFALSACGGSKQDSAPAADTATPSPSTSETGPSLANAPASFAQCTSCHTIKPGVNAVGPTLFGVYGRKAGAVADYNYTDANKNSGLTWDEATLDKYLTSPMTMVPGTRMTYAGQADAAKRKEIIEFLKTVK